jgi:ribosomal protein L37E
MLVNEVAPPEQETRGMRLRRRIAVCERCPRRKTYRALYDYCEVCGCPIATKTRFAAACPLKKW